MSNDSNFDDTAELMQSFSAEAQDLLDDVEPQLIKLQECVENTGEIDDDVLNSIFRIFHTMKGSAGFLELNNLQVVTHEAETLLDLYRKGKMSVDKDQVYLLLRTIDFIRKLLGNIEEYMNDKGFEMETGEIVEDLSRIIKQNGAKTEKKKKKETQVIKNEEKETQADENPEEVNQEITLTVTKEMIDQYVKESRDLLEELEQALLDAEDAPENMENIDKAFRSLHTFKGNSGLLEYEDLQKLSHKMESVLDFVRDGKMTMDAQTVRLFLKMLDVFQDGVSDVAKGNNGTIPGIDGLVQLLDEIAEDAGVKDGNPEIPTEDMAKDAAEDVAEDAAKELNDKNGEKDKEESKTVQIEEKKDSGKEKKIETENKGEEDSNGSNGKKSNSVITKTTEKKDIRISIDKVDKLVDLVGELALAKMMVIQNEDLGQLKETENFNRAVHQLNRIVSDLQYVSMSFRMIPIAATFKKMVRLVHDLSYKFNKKVKLETVGEETEVDKTVVDLIADPLVHIIRNAVDHGIESPKERKSAGKPGSGRIVIEAKHEAGEVWIVIKDDGKGLSREKILNKAVSNGLVSGTGEELSDQDVYKLIFEPGFSTAEKVTEVSGRGVGMDVVRKNLEKINGSVDIDSSLGKGTTFILRIPLTLALIDGMLVKTGKSRYIIPLLAIRESVRPKKSDITSLVDGQEVVKVRGELIPVIRLHEMYNVEPDNTDLDKGLLVIVEHNSQSFAIAVDHVLGQQQAVIKGLSEYIGSVQSISGCTILGDGRVSLILDIGTLLEKVNTRSNGNSVLEIVQSE